MKERDRARLAIGALAIAATGTPATVVVLVFSQGTAATAGAGVIGTITLAAFATSRAFGQGQETGVVVTSGLPQKPEDEIATPSLTRNR